MAMQQVLTAMPLAQFFFPRASLHSTQSQSFVNARAPLHSRGSSPSVALLCSALLCPSRAALRATFPISPPPRFPCYNDPAVLLRSSYKVVSFPCMTASTPLCRLPIGGLSSTPSGARINFGVKSREKPSSGAPQARLHHFPILENQPHHRASRSWRKEGVYCARLHVQKSTHRDTSRAPRKNRIPAQSISAPLTEYPQNKR